MKDRHIQNEADRILQQRLYKRVSEEFILSSKFLNRSLIVKFIVFFGLSVLFYASLFIIQNPMLFVAAFIMYGLSCLLFAFNFSHDFSHGTIFKSQKWNHRCFVWIYTLVGAHAEAWKYRHIHSHHFAPNVEDYDSDLQITSLIRVIPESKMHWFHKFQHIYAPLSYATYSLYWVLIKDFALLKEFQDAEGSRFKYYTSFLAQKLFYFSYLLILPLLFSAQPWYLVLVGFVAMHLIQSLFLLFTFFMTHHVESTAYPKTDQQGNILSSWFMNQISSSNDMHPFSKTANFILGGFNNHIAHHLFPQINHVFYPKLNEIIYGELRAEGIEPNYTSYWGGIRSHLRLLKKMGAPLLLPNRPNN